MRSEASIKFEFMQAAGLAESLDGLGDAEDAGLLSRILLMNTTRNFVFSLTSLGIHANGLAILYPAVLFTAKLGVDSKLWRHGASCCAE